MGEYLTDTNVGNIEYISKQDAITAACKGFCHPGVGCPETPCKEQTKYLRDLPPADVVQVVYAHWIDGYRWQTCSKCRNKGKRSWKFCPYCGAKMDGGEDD